MKYLRHLLLPIIEEIKKEPQKLIVNRESKTEEEIISRNKSLKILDDFFQRFLTSSLRCPM